MSKPRAFTSILKSIHPRVQVFENFLSARECREVRSMAEPYMQRALVENGEINPIRTSSGLFLPRSDLAKLWNNSMNKKIVKKSQRELISDVEKRISKATGFPLKNGEPSQVMRYEENEEYKLHMDAFDPEWQFEEIENGGNRSATFLIYLSTLSKGCGGNTVFPHATPPLRVRPVEGRAVLWWNLNNAAVDPLSEHLSEPVENGQTKWALSKWFREEEFNIDEESWSKSLLDTGEW